MTIRCTECPLFYEDDDGLQCGLGSTITLKLYFSSKDCKLSSIILKDGTIYKPEILEE